MTTWIAGLLTTQGHSLSPQGLTQWTLRIMIAVCVAPVIALGQQQPSWQSPPKLVVGIVVDQMRTDYIYRYWDNFGDGGFKRLIGEGAFLRDAHYNYIPTVTGPGHASIYTGTTPSRHGIVANEMYDRAARKTYYCVNDTSMNSVGTSSTSGERSPHLLLATTLADELELRFDRHAKTIGIAIKDRSAILPIGRMGDAAYWYSAGSGGSFISSSWFMKELPKWAEDFNGDSLAVKYMNNTWDLALPPERYHEVLPDDNPYEIPLKSGLRPTLPVNLDSLRKAGAGLDLLTYTPWGNTITTDMALAALAGEAMGTDAITDLLAISYSSPDLLGHRVGPRGLELEDMYIRLDQELKRLLDELDKRVGAAQYTVFLTADHGAVDVPAYLRDMKGSAGYVDVKELGSRILRAMPAQVSGGTLYIDTILDGQVFLRGAAGNVADLMRTFPEIHSAIAPQDAGVSEAADELLRAALNGYMPQRSGNVLFTLRPGFLEKEDWSHGHGTSHGSGWTYDTHVPVIFFGKGVQKGEILRPTEITDIVPTVCAIVGMALPNAASGAVVHQVLGSR